MSDNTPWWETVPCWPARPGEFFAGACSDKCLDRIWEWVDFAIALGVDSEEEMAEFQEILHGPSATPIAAVVQKWQARPGATWPVLFNKGFDFHVCVAGFPLLDAHRA